MAAPLVNASVASRCPRTSRTLPQKLAMATETRPMNSKAATDASSKIAATSAFPQQQQQRNRPTVATSNRHQHAPCIANKSNAQSEACPQRRVAPYSSSSPSSSSSWLSREAPTSASTSRQQVQQQRPGRCASAQLHHNQQRPAPGDDRERHDAKGAKQATTSSVSNSGRRRETSKRMALNSNIMNSNNNNNGVNRPSRTTGGVRAPAGSTNPLAVAGAITSASRIPRRASVQAKSAESVDDDARSTASSLDLSVIGRNRSSVSSVASTSNTSIHRHHPTRSRLLQPGTIVAKNVELQRQQRQCGQHAQHGQQRASKLPVAQHHPLQAAARRPARKDKAAAKECASTAGDARGPSQGRASSEWGPRRIVTPAVAVAAPSPAAPIPDESQHLNSASLVFTSEQACDEAPSADHDQNKRHQPAAAAVAAAMSETSDEQVVVRVQVEVEQDEEAVTQSCEMLSRLESERQSIRGPATAAPPVGTQADAQLMEMLECDVLSAISCDAAADASAPRRSFSLPKSFLSNRYGLNGLKAALPSVRFPWRTKAAPPTPQWATSEASEVKNLPPTTSGVATIRRLAQSTARVERQVKSNSICLESEAVNRSLSAWDLTGRPWSVYEETSHSQSDLAAVNSSSLTDRLAPDVIGSETERQSPDSSTGSSATLRKFRKSFSLRLNRRASQDETKDEPDICAAENGSRFRFGVFRSSRERNNKKACPNKAARNAKCNSGDSGVQMEGPPNVDEIDCPGTVRRPVSDFDDEAAIVLDARPSKPEPVTWYRSVEVAAPSSTTTTTTTTAASGGSRTFVPFIRSRKLSRHLAKAKLRRSASQPVVAIIQSLSESSPGRGDGPSDDDAGLYLSEDDNLSDDAHEGHTTVPMEGVLAIALWNHSAVESEELSLQAGDMVHILDLSDPDWWWASNGSNYGWLPASYVQLCEQPLGHHLSSHLASKKPHCILNRSASALRHSVRANVINELITAERDYVKLLSDLVDGYLKPMRCRPDLFNPKMIESIFGNLEELYRFQKKFLVDLELALDWNTLEDSVVGNVFIQHIQNFTIYATYCNNHDRAAAQMQILYKDLRYVKFFEACRLLRRMIRLPLEAFLLSPVQKICKYPLQLAELLKHTPEEHLDRRAVSHALESMRSVAYLVNESKRRAEMHQFLVQWQSGVDHWTGPDITERNTRLVRQGEMYKISSNGWAREVTLFLFDKELVICKKDLIKRSSLVYKDRLSVADVDAVEPSTVIDGRPNAFQLRTPAAKCYTLSCRSELDKRQWLATIRQLQQQEPSASDWATAAPAAPSSDPHSPPFPVAFPTLGRQKVTGTAKRTKGKQYSTLSLTLEEARLTLVGRDPPNIKRKF